MSSTNDENVASREYQRLFDEYRAAMRAGPASNVEGARARLDAYFLSGALGDAVGADMHALYKFVTALEAGCAWEARARFDELSGEQQSVIVANESFPGEGRIWLRQIDRQR